MFLESICNCLLGHKGPQTFTRLFSFHAGNAGKRDILKNQRIHYPSIIVIDENNNRLGPLNPRQYLATLDLKKYDLVLVNPKNVPPLARLIPRAMAVEQERRQEEIRSLERRKTRMKEVQFGSSIGEHDRRIRLDHLCEFLEKAYRVKMVVESKGVSKRNPIIKEQLQSSLMSHLREKYGKDLQVISPTESLYGKLTTVLSLATAKPPATKNNKDEIEENKDS